MAKYLLKALLLFFLTVGAILFTEALYSTVNAQNSPTLAQTVDYLNRNAYEFNESRDNENNAITHNYESISYDKVSNSLIIEYHKIAVYHKIDGHDYDLKVKCSIPLNKPLLLQRNPNGQKVKSFSRKYDVFTIEQLQENISRLKNKNGNYWWVSISYPIKAHKCINSDRGPIYGANNYGGTTYSKHMIFESNNAKTMKALIHLLALTKEDDELSFD